ncbi:MAG: hypothetical protein R2716_08980 [Microthrixaceae bacterium]
MEATPEHSGGSPGGSADPAVLRGATLVSAPFTLVGIVCSALCALSVGWVFGAEASEPAAGWLTAAAFGVVGLGALLGARGCRLVVDGRAVRDQVAWITVWSADTAQIVAVRVRRGPWRVFEAELSDGSRRVLLGAGPVQFPANLSPDAAERDRRVVDKLCAGMGA